MKLNNIIQRVLVVFLLTFLTYTCFSQVFYNNGNEIWVNHQAIVAANGDIVNANGILTLTNNTTDFAQLVVNGNLTNNSQINCEGNIDITGNWYNNADFVSNEGSVFLLSSNQVIGGSEVTSFNNLSAISGGTKTLEQDIYILGILDINDSEFDTGSNFIEISNIDNDAVVRNHGFVSSDSGGYLSRKTDLVGEYLFPVGSYFGTERYRPVIISQFIGENSEFRVRFINNDATNDGMSVSLKDTLIDVLNNEYYHYIHRVLGTNQVKLEIIGESSDNVFDAISFWNNAPVAMWELLENSVQVVDANNYIFRDDNLLFDNKSFFVLARKLIIDNPDPEPDPDPDSEFDFTIFNSFSPNGDNFNDMWEIEGIGNYPNCTVNIFNRNGNEVFNSKGYLTPWNGEYKGKKVPDATYYYIIDLYGDGSELRKGSVTIIR
ncbi:MAG: gliding motility-associated C-terminal domain-containing protein [Bacteroidales bacterium]|nr:gliding motility-associated C-terminal domain-containing protein [Bacteroidales bacterium]MDY0140294.1 gliding motility-associated C-terminal domain-containing protein [Bacteroidales bacterium]